MDPAKANHSDSTKGYSQSELARQIKMAPALFRRASLMGRTASDFAVRSINRAIFAQVLRRMP